MKCDYCGKKIKGKGVTKTDKETLREFVVCRECDKMTGIGRG